MFLKAQKKIRKAKKKMFFRQNFGFFILFVPILALESMLFYHHL